MYKTTLRPIGNSLGVILPRRLVDELHAAEGETLVFSGKAPDLRVRVVTEQTLRALEVFEQDEDRFRGLMGQLANV